MDQPRTASLATNESSPRNMQRDGKKSKSVKMSPGRKGQRTPECVYIPEQKMPCATALLHDL